MATPITITIPHKLTRAEATTRVTESVERFKQQMGSVGLGQMRHAWAGDRLSFHAQALGQTITGRVDVNDHDLKIEVDLPALLAGFADKLRGKLQREGPKLLEKK
jgi:hypothetical protein